MKERNKFYVLNHLIHSIYNVKDFEQMKKEFVFEMKNVVPNCCAALFMVDSKDQTTLSRGVYSSPTYSQIDRRYNLIKDKDFFEWLLKKRQQVVVRMTDLMEEENLEKTDYYKLLYGPYNVHYTAYMTIASRNKLLGILALYRKKDDVDFTEDDLFWIQLVGEHLNERFYHEQYSYEESEETLEILGLEYIKRFNLTVREIEIISKVLRNETNESICDDLDISIHTLKKHLQHIYRKTGVNSRKKLIHKVKQEI